VVPGLPRALAATAALAIALVLSACAPPPAASSAPPPPPEVLFPRHGAYLGVSVHAGSGQTEEQAISAVETQLGRPLAVDRIYHRWWDAFPTADDRASANAGRLLFISWSAETARGKVVPWADIASGRYDAWIRARADAIRAFGRPMYFCFHHEPEDDTAFGTPEDYISAYRHVVDVFREQRVTNVAFVWTMMSSSFVDGGARAVSFYPGDVYVDAVGVDAYNWSPGRPGTRWRSFAEVVSPARAFAREHAEPLIVAEFGVQEDPADPGRKAAWIRAAAATIRSWPDLKAALYYDSDRVYPWRIDSSATSQAAFASVGAETGLNVLPATAVIDCAIGLTGRPLR